ncbi:glycosyl hydrolase family 18 protein [Spongiactinospora sp. 9N601]|uniref:glycosyl hydrolase family 18 protein n=1 Tax=Spongiactinospora sp. 9N601 TaxID=3375149 RepID=UPI0037B58518
MTLVAGLLVVVPQPPSAQAAVAQVAMTWNLHGSGQTAGKVADLMRDHDVKVAALQEVVNGPFLGLTATNHDVRHLNTDGTTSSPLRWRVEEYTLSGDGGTAFVIRTNSNNRGIAIVTTLDVANVATDVHVVNVRDDWDGNSAFPALGVKVDGAWYYSIHATTAPKRANNNADTLVEDISSLHQVAGFTSDWAAMGDWNRFPTEDTEAWRASRNRLTGAAKLNFAENQAALSSITDLDPGERIISQGSRTHDHGAELDFMVAKGAGNGYNASRAVSRYGSDHWPVFFGAAGTGTCTGGTSPTPANAPRAAAEEACPIENLQLAAVSMGDSYISGEGGRWQGNANTSSGGDSWGTDRSADGRQVYEKNGDGSDACHRSDVAEIKGAEIPGVPRERRFNIACSGAETKHLLSDSFKGEKPQIEQLAELAAEFEVHTIAVSIGGNDLGFSDIVKGCVQTFMVNGPACRDGADEMLKERLGDVGKDVSKVLSTIRATMSDAGQDEGSYRLVLQSYPSPLPPTEYMRYPGDHYDRYTQGGCPFYDEDLTWTREGAIKGIGDMLRRAANGAGVAFLDLKDAFAGHELCASSARQAKSGESLSDPMPADESEWVRFIQGFTTPGELAEAIHPNAHGQVALSACLSDAVQKIGESGQKYFPCVGRPGDRPGDSRLTRSPIDDAVETVDPWRGEGFRLADHYLFQDGVYARFNPDADIDGTIHPGDVPIGKSDGWLGAVKDTGDNWPSLRGTDFSEGIDAVFEARTRYDKELMLFRGDQYVRVELDPETGNDKRVKGPGPIRDFFHPFRGTVFESGVDAAVGDQENRALVFRDNMMGVLQVTIDANKDSWLVEPTPIAEAIPALAFTPFAKRVDAALIRHQRPTAMWVDLISGNQVVSVLVMLSDLRQSRLETSVVDLTVMWPSLRGSIFDWTGGVRPNRQDLKIAAGVPYDNGEDGRQNKAVVPGPHSQCRPEGLTATRGVDTPYCLAYDADGREWLGGGGRDKRVVGYFTGWRTGANNQPRYLVPNIPWSKLTHINYAFAKVDGNKISVGDTTDPNNPATGMTWPDAVDARPDPGLSYKGHFNLLAKFRKRHPQVKTLISVGGWADTRNFYAMATNADGSVNQSGIDTFADSVVEFLDRYKAAFDGVDIDYEYPSALPKAGNPADWELSDPRRKGLQKGYNALMKTLREKLDRAGADRGRYYLLTSAASASGYLVRGFDAGEALRYQDFVNLMTYDMHGSWNHFVGPQAPLYDDGKDNELEDADFYTTKEYDKTGYFNVDWAYHYYRGALPPGRINIGIPYYTRGWRNVAGGTDGLWGTAALPDQGQCQPGTGPGSGSSTPVACGNGAVGIDNLWHDLGGAGQEVASGSNPMWHAKNLQKGRAPNYLRAYTDAGREEGQLKGTYEEKYDDTLKAPWLWNADKKVFLSTENNASLDAKIDYVKEQKLGGVMMWELAGDYTELGGGDYGMGYDMTTRLDEGLRGSGGYQTTRAGETTLPNHVVDVKAELVDYPTGKDPEFPNDDPFYPMRPKLRITNDTDVALPSGTEIAFDIPTSAPPILRDGNYQEFGKNVVIDKGREGSNIGGLKADFHRVTVKLGYCEDIAPGASHDIVLRHYLPLTGPANVTLKTGPRTYGSTQNDQKDATTVTPEMADGVDCQAEEWEPHPYNPRGTFAFEKDGDDWRIVDWVGSNVLDHPESWDTPHLVDNQPGNENQLWSVDEDGGSGWYRIKSRGKCLQADGVLKSLSVHDCDDEPHQWWQLRTMRPGEDDIITTGTPAAGTGYQLVSFADDSYEPAYVAEGKNSGNRPGTEVVAGDLDGTTASTVIWNGFYWRANWWTTATDEPGKGGAWKKLGPAPGAATLRQTPNRPTTTTAPPPAAPPAGPREGRKPDPHMKPALPKPRTS